MAKWITAKGEIMNLSDMTDEHLNNSILFCERNNSIKDLKLLKVEKERRNSRLELNGMDAQIENNLWAKKEIMDAAARGNKICGMYAALAWMDFYGVDDLIDYDPTFNIDEESGGMY
ncbi:MAG TPA: hypothetical protein PKU78_05400 [Candidatus Dojkabacteria bacterium]|nr:hypothetical protein [Candidatus Dojkabacteria bacterium]